MSATPADTFRKWSRWFLIGAVGVFALAWIMAALGPATGIPPWFVALSYAMAPLGAALAARIAAHISDRRGGRP